MYKLKTILALGLLALPIRQAKPADCSAIIDLDIQADATNSELLNMLHAINVLQREYLLLENRWVDSLNMSFADFCDELIFILDTHGDKLPTPIKINLRNLIREKRTVSNISELKSGHVLVNDILIQLIDLKLECLNKEISTILKFIPISDFLKIKEELHKYKRDVSDKKKRHRFIGIAKVSDDIQKIYQKLAPIYTELVRNNPDALAQISQKRLGTDLSSKLAAMNAISLGLFLDKRIKMGKNQ